MVEVIEGGEEGTLLNLRLLEVLLLECLLVNPPLDLLLYRAVFSLALALTRVVVTWASLLLTLLRATGDEVVRVTTVEAFILEPAMMLVLAVVVEPHEPTGHIRQLLIPEAFTCSSMIDSKEDRANKAGEGLEEEPSLDTRVMVGALGFSILVWD
jgi:hypothetical protein